MQTEVIQRATGALTEAVRVEMSHAPTLNFSMEQSGVPVVTSARIQNAASSTLEDATLHIAIEPGIVSPAAHPIPRLRAGESFNLTPIDVRLLPGRLAAILEAERAQLTWEVRVGERAVASGHGAIDVLAYNEWAGLRAPPALLATFVTPNDPIVAGVLKRVRDRLRTTTGDGAITGYQTHSVERARQMVTALYETVQSFGISYVGAPASFQDAGQKVRLAGMVLGEGMGNCLDISVLMASCLEQMGLSPLIAILDKHALPGVWLLDERFPEGVVYDAARLRNAAALDQILFFDSSTAVTDPAPTLAQAEQVAKSLLQSDKDFRCIVDVSVARRDHYRPLPLRAVIDRATTTVQGARSEEARAIVREAEQEHGAGLARQGAPDSTGPVSVGADSTAKSPSAARFKQWRDKLLDLSLRNKLLNFRTDAKSALTLQIPNIARIEDLLAADKTFDIQPRPTDLRDERDEKLTKTRTPAGEHEGLLAADIEKGIIHCPMDEARMLKHAIHLDREARTAQEEGGANVLYMAIGFLKWFESETSPNPKLAPLLLVPVALEYVRTTRRVRLRRLQEESSPNDTLVEKMSTDFAVDLRALTNVEADESGLDVPGMLRGVREAIQRMPRWEVLDEAHLGLFSFAKFLMWKDLGENQEVLLQNDVIKHIASKSNRAFPETGKHVGPRELDDAIRAGDLPLVVDADSTQTAAVVSALNGRSFVLQGPPGTGKSQTITNLIAAALARGKTVLFVSEKMAALDVVYRRLQNVGLGDFCLELHSHKAQKREVIQSLGSTLNRGQTKNNAAWQGASLDLDRKRGTLNTYVRAIHAPRPLGLTFHQATAKLLTSTAPEIRLKWPDILGLDASRLAHAVGTAHGFGTAASQVEPIAQHPFRESAVEGWTAQGDQDARDALAATHEAGTRLKAAQRAFLDGLGTSDTLQLRELEQLAQLGQTVAGGPVPDVWKDENAWKHLRKTVAAYAHATDDQGRRRTELARRWSDALLEAQLEELTPRFAKWATAFFIFAWLFLRSSRNSLKAFARAGLPGNHQIKADLRTAREVKETQDAILKAHREISGTLEGCGQLDSPAAAQQVVARGDALRAAAARTSANAAAMDRLLRMADPNAAADVRRTVGDRSAAVLAALAAYKTGLGAVSSTLRLDERMWPQDSADVLTQVLEKVARLITAFPAFRPWALYRRCALEMNREGLWPIVEAHWAGTIAGADAAAATERGLVAAWSQAVRDSDPTLRDFNGKTHHSLVDHFRAADGNHIKLAQTHVASVVEAKLPKASTDDAASSEPGILKRELGKKTRHMPLRKLLQQIPNLLVRLKPCLLMSPLSVAQYLPAKGKRFDLVVFDEASQICTHDAIGAIGRGAQVVVVGDSKQLPPTAFFQRTAGEEDVADENDFAELESILDEAIAVGLPEQMLEWHYRSRHEALIDFSNQHYYDGRLNVFPAARGRVDDLGVKFHHVKDGVYDSGKSRTNEREARDLVAHLTASLRQTPPAARSFGIVTFSMAQQERVEELLNDARRDFPEIEPHFANNHPTNEAVFVKNLENVQGDERDEILFSIAYGTDTHGKKLMNFGPVNRDGGERRLNVAVTRARKQLRVFASITADWIDTSRARGRGAAHLKDFLRFAQQSDVGVRDDGEPDGDFDSDFERNVYDALRASGHRVRTQVGCGGYRIDLAVVHPEQPGVFALGVECDGAAYHSGATARDRDRLRQSVLEGLGWRMHRIWSTDWLYDREAELNRLLTAIDEAARGVPAEAPPVATGLTAPTEREAEEVATGPTTPRMPVTDVMPVVPYRRSQLATASADPEALYLAAYNLALRTAIEKVAYDEAPVHIDELGRRVLGAFGGTRLTPRVRKRIGDMVGALRDYAVVDDFVWPRTMDRTKYVSVRTAGPGEEARDAEAIPAEEVAAAAAWIMERAFSMSTAELITQTARVFGIKRVGQKVEERMMAGVQLLVRREICRETDARLTWVAR